MAVDDYETAKIKYDTYKEFVESDKKENFIQNKIFEEVKEKELLV